MVIADTFAGKEMQNKEEQPEEGEITGSQEEKTNSSPFMNNTKMQEAQKCTIMGMNLSDSDQNLKIVNSASHDSITPKWGNEDEISRLLKNSEVVLEKEADWKIPKYRNKKGSTPSASQLRKSNKISQVDVGYISSSPGRPSNHKVRDKEASKNIVDGTQKTLKELGIGK